MVASHSYLLLKLTAALTEINFREEVELPLQLIIIHNRELITKNNKLLRNNIYLNNSFISLEQNPTLPFKSFAYYGGSNFTKKMVKAESI